MNINQFILEFGLSTYGPLNIEFVSFQKLTFDRSEALTHLIFFMHFSVSAKECKKTC